MSSVLLPVILSGGAGTRLWPLSRRAFPKQFHNLVDDLTLLQTTVLRCDGLSGLEVASPLVVCNEMHRFLVADQLLACDRQASDILLEPAGRNTAPALTLAALHATCKMNDPVLLVMPADHVIRDEQAFTRALETGMRQAAENKIVTFGIVPRTAHTGYGYIRHDETLDDEVHRIDAFVEKPDQETADRYLRDGGYLWNSGIFMVRASRWLELTESFTPEIHQAISAAHAGRQQDPDFVRMDAEAFTACPADSIDYAVMEPLSRQGGDCVVVPLDAGWSDIGAWEALWEVSHRDEQGNAIHGDVMTLDARNNLLFSQHRLVAAVGIKDLVVVETPDAVLVANNSHAQEVEKIAERLQTEGRSEHKFHRCVHRPWGTFENIDQGHQFQVKRLTVKPGASLSLQMHHHRAEHWIVVHGTARVTRVNETFLLTENQSTYIPIGTRHRLENPDQVTLEIIEVQSGSYLGEDDIVRFEDDYNRRDEN